ncbi:hypothetical protein GP486_003083 [Trichoglossum hirsutum]|uniref:Uncharacterized protein n=1 Tax=Trichoglossum hirsutum TaxID=265104 RepID=A0A9P8LDR5_9PEZI|nr:hypothetical protein GP486_003083 [Trichoglossum hirsutum]
MHEIITLQFGQSSNYLATHFWNTQGKESYFSYEGEEVPLNHDIHFRPGIGANGTETFTPRTLVYDLKGGFGSLKKINALYEIGEENMPNGLWDGQPIVQRETPIKQHPYQQSLDEGLKPPELTTETVRFWSDFNRVFYHPRSIIQLNEFELNSTLTPFEKWGVGEELFGGLDKEYDLLDRDLRPFAEESDHLQALQVMTGVDDAWGGFAARYLERLRDEYGKTSIWAWGLESGHQNGSREEHQSNTLNLARSLQGMSPQASLYIPLAIPPRPLPSYVSLDRESEWHRSGLLSAAVETITLPSRLKAVPERQVTLTRIEDFLNTNGNQKIACLQLSVLKPEFQNSQGATSLSAAASDPRQTRDLNKEDAIPAGPAALDMMLSPSETVHPQKGLASKIHTFGQLEVVRGKGSDTVPPSGFRLSIVAPVYSGVRNPDPPMMRALLLCTPHWVDEREALLNELGEIREAYEEGWDSGTDEDDD